MKKPQNYYCHRAHPQSQEISNKGYEVIDKIGEGAFGQVFKVFDIESSSIQVIKRTKGENSNAIINREGEIMSELENSDGFARVKSRDKQNGCLVMTFLGQNLQNILDKQGISLVDMKRIAYQCIIRLKELHEKGFVHRDLKPQNLLMGNRNNPHKIYLVDFGLSSTFKKTATSARKIYNGEIGTIKYCPIASHLGMEQFPKDDLESLGYLLIYIASKKLPWSDLPKDMDTNEKYRQIKMRKQKSEIDKLCQGIGCLKKYFKVIKSLQIGDKVDYDELLRIFKIECKQIYCFSFCKHNCLAKGKEQIQNSICSEENEIKAPQIFTTILKKSRSNPFVEIN